MLMLNHLCGFGAGGMGVYPTVVGSSKQDSEMSTSSGGGSTWSASTEPPGMQNGDLHIVALFQRGSGADLATAVDGIFPWTTVLNAPTASGRLYVWSRTDQAGSGGPGGNFATGLHAYSVVQFALRGAVIDVVGTVATSLVASAITPTSEFCLVLGLFAAIVGSGTIDIVPPGSFTELQDAAGDASAPPQLELCFRQWPTASSTGTATATISGTGTAEGAVLLAVKPG